MKKKTVLRLIIVQCMFVFWQNMGTQEPFFLGIDLRTDESTTRLLHAEIAKKIPFLQTNGIWADRFFDPHGVDAFAKLAKDLDSKVFAPTVIVPEVSRTGSLTVKLYEKIPFHNVTAPKINSLTNKEFKGLCDIVVGLDLGTTPLGQAVLHRIDENSTLLSSHEKNKYIKQCIALDMRRILLSDNLEDQAIKNLASFIFKKFECMTVDRRCKYFLYRVKNTAEMLESVILIIYKSFKDKTSRLAINSLHAIMFDFLKSVAFAKYSKSGNNDNRSCWSQIEQRDLQNVFEQLNDSAQRVGESLISDDLIAPELFDFKHKGKDGIVGRVPLAILKKYIPFYGETVYFKEGKDGKRAFELFNLFIQGEGNLLEDSNPDEVYHIDLYPDVTAAFKLCSDKDLVLLLDLLERFGKSDSILALHAKNRFTKKINNDYDRLNKVIKNTATKKLQDKLCAVFNVVIVDYVDRSPGEVRRHISVHRPIAELFPPDFLLLNDYCIFAPACGVSYDYGDYCCLIKAIVEQSDSVIDIDRFIASHSQLLQQDRLGPLCDIFSDYKITVPDNYIYEVPVWNEHMGDPSLEKLIPSEWSQERTKNLKQNIVNFIEKIGELSGKKAEGELLQELEVVPLPQKPTVQRFDYLKQLLRDCYYAPIIAVPAVGILLWYLWFKNNP